MSQPCSSLCCSLKYLRCGLCLFAARLCFCFVFVSICGACCLSNWWCFLNIAALWALSGHRFFKSVNSEILFSPCPKSLYIQILNKKSRLVDESSQEVTSFWRESAARLRVLWCLMLLCVSLQIDRRLKTPSWGTTAASRRRIRCFCWGVWGERSLCLRIRLFQILTLMIYTKILCEYKYWAVFGFVTYVNKWWAKTNDFWLR